ncbi:MAG: threonine/serine exporter family protein [Sarcina sp.]
MMNDLIQIISSTLGTLGFAIFFNTKKNRLIPATIGGVLTIVVYLICYNHTKNIFLSNLVGAVAITIYSEIFARYLKCPTTVLLFSGVIPLVPGGSLFYTMNSAVLGEKAEFYFHASQTMQVALGLAVGILLTTVFAYHVNKRARFKIKFKK